MLQASIEDLGNVFVDLGPCVFERPPCDSRVARGRGVGCVLEAIYNLFTGEWVPWACGEGRGVVWKRWEGIPESCVKKHCESVAAISPGLYVREPSGCLRAIMTEFLWPCRHFVTSQGVQVSIHLSAQVCLAICVIFFRHLWSLA